MHHLIRTLFSLALILALTVAGHPIQSALLKRGFIYILDLTADVTFNANCTSLSSVVALIMISLADETKGLGKRFQSIRPDASVPRPWVKAARDFRPEGTAQLHEKRSSQPVARSISKIRRRPAGAIDTSRHTTGWSNPRPWVQKDEVISSI
ncbi:hypothetical protein MJO28_010933 [Puccinia striiformis f. sp. tritici]|uniref:Uncharacterized protein n=1 Tax=Puccinia striiformis f. sp. tritici TaxID=168172 RepID=A0ACC0E605_9BASI|nr:hypothetical protein MJO28_010933 [Puccinia striiformis f. sp. tritici]KAI7949007.1 hypothetical protein MJO29_010672 [Puccinia striiformis f. sp. tritici]